MNNEQEKYLYFINNFEKKQNLRIECNKKAKYIYEDTFEKIYSENIEGTTKAYDISVYRIRLDQTILKNTSKDHIILPIILNEDNYIFELKTYQVIDLNKNNFLFDLQLRNPRKVLYIKEDPNFLNIPQSLQFDLYMKVLKDKYHKKITDEECQDLKNYAQDFIFCYYDKKHQYKEYLYYFTDIFIEFYEIKDFSKKFLLTFNIENFDSNEYCNNQKVEIKDKIKSMIENTHKTFQDFDDDDDKGDIRRKALTFLFLCFNFKFQSDLIYQMFNNSDLRKYIYDVLLEHLDLFKYKLHVSKESLGILVQKTTTYKLLNDVLLFNKNILDLLEVINEQKDHIIELIPSNQKINIQQLVKLKDNDKLDQIHQQIKLIIFDERKTEQSFVFLKKICLMII